MPKPLKKSKVKYRHKEIKTKPISRNEIRIATATVAPKTVQANEKAKAAELKSKSIKGNIGSNNRSGPQAISTKKDETTMSNNANKANTASQKPGTQKPGGSQPYKTTTGGRRPYVASRYLQTRDHDEIKLLRELKSKGGGNKDICLLARMKAEGRKLTGKHRDCIKDVIGECCTQRGGYCTDIFEGKKNKD